VRDAQDTKYLPDVVSVTPFNEAVALLPNTANNAAIVAIIVPASSKRTANQQLALKLRKYAF
jgi:hypothetical protein